MVSKLSRGLQLGRRTQWRCWLLQLRILLDQLVGNLVARQFVANGERDPVFRRQVALEADREITGRAAIGEVFRHDRIQIVGGHAAGGAAAEDVVSPGILGLGEGGRRIETAAGENGLPVKALLGIAQSVDLDHAAHLASKFGGNSRGVNMSSDSTSSASISGPKLGERLSVSGMPSTTNCV